MAQRNRIDFHTHIVVDLPDFAERLGDPRWPVFRIDGAAGTLWRDGTPVRSLGPNAWLPQSRIEDMDAVGIDRQVLSPIPPLICDWAQAADAAEWAERVNTGIAAVVDTYPDRFSGLGTVPLHHPDAAIEVLRHAKAAGLAGVEIGTTAGTRELDNPDLREFFHAAADLGMLIYIHPLALGAESSWTNRIAGPASIFGLGMGTDTAIAASRIVFGGVAADCPELRICLAHGGGTFLWALSRIARLWDRANETTADALIGNVFVDSVVYQAENLEYLWKKIGAARIVFGTDYPLPAQDDLYGSMLNVLPSKEAEQVSGTNAAELLGLSPTA